MACWKHKLLLLNTTSHSKCLLLLTTIIFLKSIYEFFFHVQSKIEVQKIDENFGEYPYFYFKVWLLRDIISFAEHFFTYSMLDSCIFFWPPPHVFIVALFDFVEEQNWLKQLRWSTSFLLVMVSRSICSKTSYHIRQSFKQLTAQ